MTKKTSLVITCCLLVLKTLTRYNLDVNAGAHVPIYLCLSSCTDEGCIDDRVISIMVSPFQYTFPSPLLLLLLTPVFFCSNMLLFGRNTELSSIKPDDHLIKACESVFQCILAVKDLVIVKGVGDGVCGVGGCGGVGGGW